MFGLFKNSIFLFCKGRLFKNINYFLQQACIGILIAAMIVIVMVKMGLALWIAVVTASLVSGVIQPYLFKDLKYM